MDYERLGKKSLTHNEYIEFLRKQKAKLKDLTRFRIDPYYPKRASGNKVVFTKPFHNKSFNPTLNTSNLQNLTIYIPRKKRWMCPLKSIIDCKENTGSKIPNGTTRNTVNYSTISTAKNVDASQLQTLDNNVYYNRRIRVFIRRNIRIIPCEAYNKSIDKSRTYFIDDDRNNTSNDIHGCNLNEE